MKFSFIKTPGNRKFHHTPIYYDEAKEEREERARRIKDELGVEQEADERTFDNRVRGKMRRKISGNYDVVRNEKKRSNFRLAVILIGLFIAFYYLFMSSTEWIMKYM